MTFDDVFQGHPSIVVFFYTRCDNPLKCSLTITKLGRIQQLLAERGLAAQVQTAAITYDPAFDLPHRLRTYGARRGVRLGEGHRMLRAVGGVGPLRRHFKLGVNFIESLVNRHRIEAYVLDVKGHIAFSFERLRWDEREVVERAIDVMGKVMADVSEGPAGPPPRFARRTIGSLTVGTLAAVGWAFFPKCPVCWSGYLSAVGIAGLERIPYSPSLQPLLLAIMIVNLAGAWLRAYSTGRRAGASLATAGVLAIGLSIVGWLNVASWGVALVVGGSALNTLSPCIRQPHADDGYFPGGAASGRVGIEPFDSTSRRAM
jgi:protein SCO1/2